MISRLRGRPAGRSADGLVLDVNGVGYLLAATPGVLRRATAGAEVTVETYLHVREDALQLYGFADADERELFVHLLTVSGIGPKVALAVVSGSPSGELRKAIALGDHARFQAIPGIGKKTAERIVLELKEKLGSTLEPSLAAVAETPGHLVARDALVELGYSRRRRGAGARRGRPRAARGGAGADRAPRGRSLSQFLAPALRPEDEEVERSLRPRRLEEFVGQERVKEQLRIALDAAKQREEALDHVLLAGPPGLGKTTLAQIVREELGVGLRTVAGPALEKKDIAAILTALEPRDVLFVDEIHRLNRSAEEILYPALEDFRLDIVFGQGAAARTLTLDLPPFTLVGATTRTGLLTTPLRDRFGMTFRLGYYDPGQLATIVGRSAEILGVEIAVDAADEIASRSRGTPRIANRILRRVRDVAQVRHAGVITTDIAQEALELLEVDEQGLERMDRELLEAIAHKFGGGPVGPLDDRGRARRGDRDHRGRLRAVPAPARLPAADAARAGDHRPRSGAPRHGARRAEPLLSSQAIWTPGMAGPLDELVKRILRRIEVFKDEHGLSDVEVTVELVDGSLHRLKTLSRRSGLRIRQLPAARRRGAGGADRAARRRARDPARRTRERAGARLRRWCSRRLTRAGAQSLRNWSACQEGVGASSRSARPPLGSA